MAKSPLVDTAAAKVLAEEGLNKFAVERMRNYGMYVIEDRALPDFRDGLKPVYRRIIWAMHKLGMRPNSPYKKSARVVGEVIGKYHPHGDDPAYQAAVTMANMPVPIVDGSGNWGAFNEKAAAMRYTEAKLSRYADQIFLEADYLAVTPMMENYDGQESEPVVLPALLPNLLINGISGIAVGVIVNMPPFHIKGVVQLLKKAAGGQEITARDCARYLRINYPHPFQPKILTSDAELLEFYQTGEGRLVLGVEYTTEGNVMTINRFPPYFDMAAAKLKIIERVPEVARVDDLSDNKQSDYLLRVTLKQGTPPMDRSKIFARCADLLDNGINLRINYIQRLDAERVKFNSCNMPQLITRWLNWRLKLEQRVNKYRYQKLQERITYLQLIIFAADNLELIFQELKRRAPNLVQRLAQTLQISEDQAQRIAEMQVQRLSRISRDGVQQEIKQLQADAKQTAYYRKHPAEKFLLDLAEYEKTLAKMG